MLDGRHDRISQRYNFDLGVQKMSGGDVICRVGGAQEALGMDFAPYMVPCLSTVEVAIIPKQERKLKWRTTIASIADISLGRSTH